jgi:hypothetical protein
MHIRNFTNINVEELLLKSVESFEHSDLHVEIRYCPKGSGRFASGTYYRYTKTFPQGKFIRLRINRNNTYPVKVGFKISKYQRYFDSEGNLIIIQKQRIEDMNTPEHLLLAIFLHEFSHYLDHIEGRNGNYKQTKADKFAAAQLEQLGIIEKPSRRAKKQPEAKSAHP